uniref:Putative secreted protein n=1 Tax=Anopheles triannulatus TaxID=58253 RepID=A0A2M4B162_9DIPT
MVSAKRPSAVRLLLLLCESYPSCRHLPIDFPRSIRVPAHARVHVCSRMRAGGRVGAVYNLCCGSVDPIRARGAPPSRPMSCVWQQMAIAKVNR